MGSIFEGIQWAIVAGSSGVMVLLTSIFSFKSNRKIKDVEAKSTEFKMLEYQIVFLGNRLDDLYKELGVSEEARRQYRKELNVSEIKRHKNKNALSRAYGCLHVASCPVLARKKELDDEWESEAEGGIDNIEKKGKIDD